MAIFDIFEEVSEKTVTKSETGDARIFGILVGEVVKNYADEFPGRVCVSIHVRDKEANMLKWARVAMPSSGAEWGHYFLPEVGDQVLLAFDQGIIEKPYVIGCIPKANDKFLSGAKHEKNVHKKIVTKHGNTLLFEDAEEGDGAKDFIRLFTPEEAHQLTLDNDKKSITIKDKDGNASIEMLTEKGQITVKAKEKIILKAGDNITVTMNGTNGKITINATDLSVDCTGKINASAGGNFAISGATLKEESQGMVKISTSGMVSVEGKPVKLG